jgi:hypothetical protein
VETLLHAAQNFTDALYSVFVFKFFFENCRYHLAYVYISSIGLTRGEGYGNKYTTHLQHREKKSMRSYSGRMK